jgi:hypothetical protein
MDLKVLFKAENGREIEIVTRDPFVWAVLELMLNNGFSKKEAEIIAQKFESIITPLLENIESKSKSESK